MEYDIQSHIRQLPHAIIDCLSGPARESAITALIPGKPVGKSRPRLTRKGHAYTPSKTVVAEEYAKAVVTSQTGYKKLNGAVALEMLMVLPIPVSWSKKKRNAALEGAIRPVVTPDFDNLAKLYCDAMNGVLWLDDRQVVDGRCIKCYGAAPFVMLWCWPIH